MELSMIVQWRCIECGECCRHTVGKRFGSALSPREVQMMGQYARVHKINFEPKPLIPGVVGCKLYQMTQEVCPFLDTTPQKRRCRIYPFRPLACKMFPLHPNGLMRCTFLDEATRRGNKIVFPEFLKQAAMRYAISVQPLMREANMVYSLDFGWKQVNRFPDLRVTVT